MRVKNGLLAAMACLAALSVLSSGSRAAILETIIDTDTDATVGSITLPGLTGTTDVGVALFLDGFTQTEITSISWNLDPSTHDVIALDLVALQGANPCPNGDTTCMNSTLLVSATVAKQEFMDCTASVGQASCNSLGEAPQDLSFAPTAAPEPSTWAMMIAGFAGLACAGYWRGRRVA